MTQVAPEPLAMSKDEREPLRKQPKIPDNGCPFYCCGAAAPAIDVNVILRDGGKYVQNEDGRIVEYFVYGSGSADAKGVMLQINGTLGTGYMCANQKLVDAKLKELNLVGLSITIPGYGYTTMFPVGYKIGDWSKTDVEPVLKAEGLQDKPLWVEGTSYGAGIALGVASHFGRRVERLHLHAPYINAELRKELGLPEAIGDDALLARDSAWVNSCGSCWLHCCCSCMFNCCSPSAFDDEDTKRTEAKVPGSTALTHEDMRRASRRGINSHGIAHNSVGGVISKNWGFDVRDIDCSAMKVMISYNLNDRNCGSKELLPANPHGEFLAKHFEEKAAGTLVNVGGVADITAPNQHAEQFWKALDGTFLGQLSEL